MPSNLFGPGVAGKLQITDDELLITTNPFLETSRGAISGYDKVDKFGRNADVDTGGFEDIWDGGATWVAPTAPRVHNVTSTDANDTSAGDGARTVQVYGLDADGLLQNEIVTLAGTAIAATDGTYSMIHRMVVRSAGTIAQNVGTVLATAVTDATVTAQISPEQNQTLMAVYQVPSDKTGYLLVWYSSMNRNVTTGAANVRLLVKPPGEVFQVKGLIGLVGAGKSSFRHKKVLPLPIAASSIVKVDADVSASNTDVSAGYEILLEDN
jgi:hypothetical protein